MLHYKKLNITEDDIKNETDHYVLLYWINEVKIDLVYVQCRLTTARAKSFTGEYSDPEWYAKTVNYNKVLGVIHQLIQTRLSRINDTKAHDAKTNINKLMCDYLKETYPFIFNECLSEANKIKQQSTL